MEEMPRELTGLVTTAQLLVTGVQQPQHELDGIAFLCRVESLFACIGNGRHELVRRMLALEGNELTRDN